MYYNTWKNIKKLSKNNKCKIPASTWNERFDLLDGSYSVSDDQDYLEYITKKHETVANHPPIKIYVNKIENRITFSIKTGYYEAMKLLRRTEKKMIKIKIVITCLI